MVIGAFEIVFALGVLTEHSNLKLSSCVQLLHKLGRFCFHMKLAQLSYNRFHKYLRAAVMANLQIYFHPKKTKKKHPKFQMLQFYIACVSLKILAED